jgi:hypothetical protein
MCAATTWPDLMPGNQVTSHVMLSTRLAASEEEADRPVRHPGLFGLINDLPSVLIVPLVVVMQAGSLAAVFVAGACPRGRHRDAERHRHASAPVRTDRAGARRARPHGRRPLNSAIADRLVVSDHRRVLAVLAYLDA